MDIRECYDELARQLKVEGKSIIDFIEENHLPNAPSKNNSICFFCNSDKGLTKEHVLPRWTFEKITDKFFTTTVNNLDQTYNKTTIPACNNCNNNLLASIEKYVKQLFDSTDLNSDFFTVSEIQNIIRWLEIIEYKFQILEIRRKFKRSHKIPFNKMFAGIPISVMRANIESPNKALSQIRTCLKRLTVKSKRKKENSLLIFKTKNESFHFFHQMNEFIFLELPQCKLAVFYFYELEFDTPLEAHDMAIKIMENVY